MKYLLTLLFITLSVSSFSQRWTNYRVKQQVPDSFTYKIEALPDLAVPGNIQFTGMVYVNDTIKWQYLDIVRGRAQWNITPKKYFKTETEAYNYISAYRTQRAANVRSGVGWRRNKPTELLKN